MLVMCGPECFDVAYELSTNRWMNKKVKPWKDAAYQQWFRLFGQCVETAGFGMIKIMRPKPKLPDMVFVANAGLVYQDIFIASNFFHKERRPESEHYENFFRNHFNQKVCLLPKDAYFEGQGDAVWLDDHRLLIGYGVRTNLEGVKAVEKILKSVNPDIEVIPLEMRGVKDYKPREKIFYHLDTCLMYLRSAKSFLTYLRPFIENAAERLVGLGEIIPVRRDEAEEFICNGIEVNQTTLFLPWVNDPIRNALADFGYTKVKTFQMSEFMKAGGAVKCLIFEM